MKPVVMRYALAELEARQCKLAGSLDCLLRRSADVPVIRTIRPAEEDVDLIAFIFAHRVTILRALRAYEVQRRAVTT